MSKAAGCLFVALLLTASAPAWAEMTPQDVRGQLDSMLAERRFENDRRIEAIEKEIAAASALVNQRIDGNVKGLDIKTEALKDQLAAAIATIKETINIAASASKSAVDKAELSNEKRFESVNEFRAQQKDFQALLMPRAEAEVKMKSTADAIGLLSARMDEISGRSKGMETVWSIAAGAAGLLIGAAGVALRLRHQPVRPE